MVKQRKRSFKYIVGYLSMLLVCKAVQWWIGNWLPRWSPHYLSCLNEWSDHITFSYITCLNKRNLPKANKANILQ